ncbi:MAG: DNA polymerase ligase N-terminal domain-containing protein [Pyrinomonadaceae bacterium]
MAKTSNNKSFSGRFVIHEHHATRLHFDLRLEIDGVGKSWAVPKGPSMDPYDKRLAVAVPDHSLSYFKFEGRLAEGTYGAGEVRIWDNGKYSTESDPLAQFEKGKLKFSFLGKKVRGEFTLIKLSNHEKNWLLIKADDKFADSEWKLKTILPAR